MSGTRVWDSYTFIQSLTATVTIVRLDDSQAHVTMLPVAAQDCWSQFQRLFSGADSGCALHMQGQIKQTIQRQLAGFENWQVMSIWQPPVSSTLLAMLLSSSLTPSVVRSGQYPGICSAAPASIDECRRTDVTSASRACNSYEGRVVTARGLCFRQVSTSNRPYTDIFDGEQRGKLVYLTADAEEEMGELAPHDILIIGGLVDRNRHKSICFNRAQQQVCLVC